MKTNRVNIKNEDKIKLLLDEVQKRSYVRNIEYSTIVEYKNEVERKFAIKGKTCAGFKVYIDPFAQRYPNSYKGRPESTQFALEYNGREWFVSEVGRKYTGDSSFELSNINMTSDMMDHLVKSLVW